MTSRALRDLLGSMGDELAGCAALSATLDTAVGRHVTSEADIAAMQALDLLSQTLTGLAGFVARLATTAPDAVRIDLGCALDGVGLEQLARSLAGRAPGPRGPDVELFG